jgi:CO dehydrogenase maturation factor
MTKEAYLEINLNNILLENRNFDLMTMGRGEGQDCYCYPNLILRKFIDRLSDNYAYMVMDNEAGMEHLSRGTTQDVDELLIVSNHSVKGVRTVARIKELISELKLRVKHQSIVINMVQAQLDPFVVGELEKLGLQPDGIVPQDEQIYEYDLKQIALLNLPDNSGAVKSIDRLMSKILARTVKT